LAAHPAPIVRIHAVWALQQIAGAAAPVVLAAARADETDPLVMAEYTDAPSGGDQRPAGAAEP
jgi:hypothetical protein